MLDLLADTFDAVDARVVPHDYVSRLEVGREVLSEKVSEDTIFDGGMTTGHYAFATQAKPADQVLFAARAIRGRITRALPARAPAVAQAQAHFHTALVYDLDVRRIDLGDLRKKRCAFRKWSGHDSWQR